MRRALALGIVMALTAGCASGGAPGYKAPVGAVTGAGLGALAGSHIGSGSGRLAAIAGLGLLGAILGYGAGESLDRADAAYAQQQQQQAAAARTYTPVPPPGYIPPPPPPPHPTAYEPPAYGYPAPGCRTYETRAWVDNRYVPVYGTVCQQWDGSWRVVR